ncbi:PDZ and LIM domain protein 7-like isoform X2 [Dreissena polymorpha]|uniref:PDZ and LIM domain protein 7-like isoform X2 n=1 Tax=Dreissena polymorpha TaxID=45954 RepID=UPI002264D959|nr:PDZ and LIM domain protein 7-like isoform X2 [Dreissena polymorpha]
MSILTLEAKLERQDPSTPWGFRLQGGKDFSSPLTIARVNPGSLAAKCGLQQGDIILKIGSKSSDTLKHKDAQDAIISYGNKLDLLLQRIREKKKTQNGFGGGGPTAQSYDKFSTPTIGSYQSPAAPAGGQANQAYNSAPKPFNSTTPSKPAPFSPALVESKPVPYIQPVVEIKPAPYMPPAVDSITSKTANINLSQPSYSKYEEADDRGNVSHQSRSFKYLQDTLESGQEPPAALRPTVDLRRSPSPNATVKKQFNAPGGLYSTENKQKQQQLIAGPEKKSEGNSDTEQEEIKFDASGKRVYLPSETFKLIHEQEHPDENKLDEKPVEVKQTRTIRVLEKQLGEGPPPAPAPPKAPAAPKPGVWAPGQGGPAAPAAPVSKPFTPAMAPKTAPSQPAHSTAAPPKPTGMGAIRGRMGDAVIKTGDAGRVPVCASCGGPIRGPFVTAMGKSWCPDHFICANPRCGNKLVDMGFVEEGGFLYCEKDYELYFAPHCFKCDAAIIGECVNALNKQYHPACFLCYHCKQPIGGTQFHLEDGNPYCENDWRQLYQTMCTSCNFPIEPGDKWVEAMSNNYHSECFNCSSCQVNLEGQAFYAKAGKPFCKKHAR